MTTDPLHRFPPPVTVLLDRRLPERATPAGYSAIIATYGLAVRVPRTLCATGAHHRIVETDGWRILTPRHAPKPTLAGHLTFALEHEGLDLALLERLFLALGDEPIASMVRATPARSRQPPRHTGLLPAGTPHGRTRAPHRQRSRTTRHRGRRGHPP